MRKVIWQAAALAALAPLAQAQSKNDAPVRTSATIGAMVTMTGTDSVPASSATTSDAAVTPEAHVSVDAPVRFSDDREAWLRAYSRLGISSEPDSTVDLAEVKSFKAATLGIGLEKWFGNVKAVAEWGFSSRLPGGVEPLSRTVRHFGWGAGIGDDDGPNLTILYGRDEACGAWGWGQVMLWGGVPIKGTSGALVLWADASVNVGPRGKSGVLGGQAVFATGDEPLNQRDVFRLGVSVDVPSAIKALSK